MNTPEAIFAGLIIGSAAVLIGASLLVAHREIRQAKRDDGALYARLERQSWEREAAERIAKCEGGSCRCDICRGEHIKVIPT